MHCSVQAYVSRARVESFSLIADMMYVSSNAPRIARSVFEICLRRGWSSCAELALALCKVCLRKGKFIFLGVNSMRSVELYQAAQECLSVQQSGHMPVRSDGI